MPDDRPCDTFTLTTHQPALPREGEGADDRRAAELVDARSALDRWHSEAIKSRDEITWLKEEIASLRAELAERDKTIKWQSDVIARPTDPSSPANVNNKEWWGKLSKAMGKVAKSYTGGNYATLAVSDLIDVWDESDEVDGEAIGDAFGEDASEEEEAFVASLPNVAEMAATHDAELNGATGRLMEEFFDANDGERNMIKLLEGDYKRIGEKYRAAQAKAIEQAEVIASQEKSLLEGVATIIALREHLAAMTAERNDYASAALAGLSAFGCTPMEGYVKDGGVSLMTADFKRAREAFKGLKAELTRVTADYNAVCSDIDEERRRIENQRRAIEEDAATIASLRAQLARAGAIEEAARGVGAGWRGITDPWEIGPAINHMMRVILAEPALASPSPGPRGTPEGERLAKWISVKDRLPNDNHLWCGPFLVHPFDNGPTAYYSPRRGRWEDHETRGVDHEITHWAELIRPPNPPKEK